MIELATQLQNTGNVQTHTFWLHQFMLGIRIWDHNRHPIALLHFQRIRHAFADDILLFARFKIAPIRAALHQPGEIDIRRSGGNARHFLHVIQCFLPVGPRLIYRLNFTVRYYRQNAVIQFACKAVHRA